MEAELEYDADNQLILPFNPVYDNDGNMWPEVRLAADQEMARRLAAAGDPWAAEDPVTVLPPPRSYPAQAPLPVSPEPRVMKAASSSSEPQVDMDQVRQAQEILRLAEKQGVMPLPHHGQNLLQKKVTPTVPATTAQKMTVDGWAMVYDQPTKAAATKTSVDSDSPPKLKSKVTVVENPGINSSAVNSPQGSLMTATLTPVPEEMQ